MENENQLKNTRENFSSKIASFFSALSSAVGLGNIWRFPVLVGLFGGASFMLCYIFFAVLIGIPVMITEFVIGRHTRSNAVQAFEVLGKPQFKITGYLGILGSLFLLFFYSSVAGWVYAYVFKSFTGVFHQLSEMPIEQAKGAAHTVFTSVTSGLWVPLFWQFISIAVVAIVLLLGIKNGIERVTKILMPILFILIIICAVMGLTLPGAGKGLNFLFLPDFSKLNTTAILYAMGLAFFKLSVGTGTMTTYGSYFTKNTNLLSNALKVCFSDILVSLFAGVAIFPVVFSFGLNPEVGPSLLFNTIPLVFSKIPFGQVLLFIFFISAAMAATMAMISLVEPIVAYLSGKKIFSRNGAILSVSALIMVVGFFTIHEGSVLQSVHIGGFHKSFFDIFDFVSQNVLLPVGGFLFVFVMGWVLDKKVFQDELTNENTVNRKAVVVCRIIIKYISPLLIFLVFLHSIGVF